MAQSGGDVNKSKHGSSGTGLVIQQLGQRKRKVVKAELASAAFQTSAFGHFYQQPTEQEDDRSPTQSAPS